MWAQSWGNLYDDIKPFKNASLVDVTAKLKALNYTAQKMFQTSDDFYTSLGLPTNVASFTGESVITKPNDRVIQCHASAWDFCDGTDFRIKMCTNINMEDFITIHHEMGHIQYYIQYRDLPLALRSGANPAFHEAVGDTMALSVATPQHLIKVKRIEQFTAHIYDRALFSMIECKLFCLSSLNRLAFWKTTKIRSKITLTPFCRRHLNESHSCRLACWSTNGAGTFSAAPSRKISGIHTGGLCETDISEWVHQFHVMKATSIQAQNIIFQATAPTSRELMITQGVTAKNV